MITIINNNIINEIDWPCVHCIVQYTNMGNDPIYAIYISMVCLESELLNA